MTTYELHDALVFKPYGPAEMAEERRYSTTVHVCTIDGEEFLSNPFYMTTDSEEHADFVTQTLALHYALTLRRCAAAMGLSPSRARKCIFTLWCTDNETGEALWEEVL